MKTVAEIIDMVEEYGELRRQGVDAHGKLAEIELAIHRQMARKRPSIPQEEVERGCFVSGYSPSNNFGAVFQAGARWAENFLKEKA